MTIEGVLYKKLKLFDLDERKLSEKNVYLNSVETLNYNLKNNTLSGVPLFNLDNDERSNNTGIMIRDLLKFTLIQNDDDIFYVDPSSKSTKDIKYIDFENGLTKINYNSNTYKKGIDDLNYLYNVHVSNIDS